MVINLLLIPFSDFSISDTVFFISEVPSARVTSVFPLTPLRTAFGSGPCFTVQPHAAARIEMSDHVPFRCAVFSFFSTIFSFFLPVTARDHLEFWGCCSVEPGRSQLVLPFTWFWSPGRVWKVVPACCKALLQGHSHDSLPFSVLSYQALFCVQTRRKGWNSRPEISPSSVQGLIFSWLLLTNWLTASRKERNNIWITALKFTTYFHDTQCYLISLLW